jgi:hypothetical protein
MSEVNDGSANAGNPWFSTVQDADLRGFAETKGWDTPEKALNSYRQLESHLGVPAERLLRLPEKADDPAWQGVRERVGFGAPADAAEYDFTTPDGFGDDYANFARSTFKEIGLPKEMAKALVDKNNAWVEQQLEAHAKQVERGITDAQAALRAEWAGKYDESMTLANRAETAMKADMGLGDDEMLAMMNSAPRAYYKLLHGYGSTMGEAQRIDGDGSGSNPLRQMSPEAAAQRIVELKKDPEWSKKYLNGDVDANAEMRHLLTLKIGGDAGR